MDITDVRIRKVNNEGKMKAVVSITFDEEFVVHDIKIIEGQNGPFIAMPSRKMGEGDFRDIAHPLVSETRNKIKDAIFVEYEKLLAEKQAAEAQTAAASEELPAAAAAPAFSERLSVETPPSETPIEGTPFGVASSEDEAPVSEAPMGTPFGDAPSEEAAPASEAPVGTPFGDATSEEATPASEAPVGTPFGETSSEDPVEEAPKEETPFSFE